MAALKGYIRNNGRVGIRNQVICIATVMCATAAVEGIVREVPEVIPVIHTDGCETKRVRTLYFTKTLENLCRHPNNYAVMLIGLGCERDNAKEIAGRLEAEGIRVWSRIIQEDGGCGKIIEEGIAQAKAYLKNAGEEERIEITFDQLVAGIETADHIYGEDHGAACAGNAEAMLQARQAANDLARWLAGQGTSVILPSGYTGQIADQDFKDVQVIKYADTVEAGGGFFLIDQDGERWKGPAEGVFNMDIPESLLSMCASGAQILFLATGAETTLGFPVSPLLKYSVENRIPDEADFSGTYTETVRKGLSQAFTDVIGGKNTCEEVNNEYGDLICTYRRTNIY